MHEQYPTIHRLGVYGGTFDPVHFGHLIAAEQCREQCRLDAVWFVPAAVPPHKQGASVAPGDLRAEMLELATAGCREFHVSRIELQRAGPSYMVDTLGQLAEEAPARELFLLMGADSLTDFPTWREPRRIAELATIVVVNRGRVAPDVARAVADIGAEFAARLQTVEMPAVDLSATDLRRRVAAGLSISYLTPRSVEMFIREHGLYPG